MTSNTIDIATINKLALYAIEKADSSLFESALQKHGATNLQECLDKAMQTNFTAAINLILAQMKPADVAVKQDTPTPVIKTRPLTYTGGPAFIRNGISIGNDNCQLIKTILDNPEEALKDLNDGIVSKEEINAPNSAGVTALSLLCQCHDSINHSDKLIPKILELGANINHKGSSGLTPFMFLCLNHQAPTKLLINYFLQNKELSINEKSTSGNTALSLAIIYNLPAYIIKNIMQDPRVDLTITNNLGDDLLTLILVMNNQTLKEDLLSFYVSLPNVKCPTITFTNDIIKKLNKSDLVELYRLSAKYC